MDPRRLQTALRELQPDDWQKFEDLASAFLAAEHPDLRTLAAPSGDDGRDGILFTPSDNPRVAIQYSVRPDWKTKVRQTAARLNEKFPGQHSVLVYLTNQHVGVEAERYRPTIMRDFGLYLDVRGSSWFLERVNRDRATEKAAELLASQTVDRLLPPDAIVQSKGRALTSAEARAGLVYLVLQWEDDTREKGLTRLSYEALVRAALRGSNKDARLTRDHVRDRVRQMVPGHPADVVARRVDAALLSLTKRSARHWKATDEFHLTFEEQQRLGERLQALESEDRQLDMDLARVAAETASAQGLALGPDVSGEVLHRVRAVIERYLFTRGEAFAAAVVRGELREIDVGDLRDMVFRDVTARGDFGLGGRGVELLVAVAVNFLADPGEAAQAPFRRLADAYTLFAFLRETADVQSAVGMMFSRGEIWVDTSLILPVMAEDLLPPDERKFTKLLSAARESGLELRAIPGVVDEIASHVHRCHTCLRVRNSERGWTGNIPFLLSTFAATGQPPSTFGKWVEQFCGEVRPVDDITEYLQEYLQVSVVSLEADAAGAPVELRAAAQEIWQAAHDRRRQGSFALDPATVQQLVAHDVESYVGIIARRKRERDSALGYTSWWLTLDTTAFAVRSLLRDVLRGEPPHSPVLSPDFLVNYLALGPVRSRVSRSHEEHLPVVLDLGVWDLPNDIIDRANALRNEADGAHERVIRRRVRDEFDKARQRRGPVAREGIAGVERRLREQLAAGRNKLSNVTSGPSAPKHLPR